MKNYSKFTPVSEVIGDLEATRSKLEKVAILTSAKNAGVIKLAEVFEATYNPYKVYGMKAIPAYDTKVDNTSISAGWKRYLNIMDMLANRVITGNDAKAKLIKEINMMPLSERVIAERVVKKDMRCGATASTINKVWPGLIPVFAVAKCDKANDKTLHRINYPAYSQEKVDAMRCCVVKKNNEIKYYSRSGREMKLFNMLDADINKIANSDMMIDGELAFLTEDMSEMMPRKTSNGLANKAIKGTITEDVAKRAVLVVWDAIPLEDFEKGESKVPYNKRFEWLKKRITEKFPSKISLVNTRIVSNLMEAKAMFKEMVTMGNEGIILKNMDSLWSGKRLKDNLKFKVEEEADLRILSLKEGSGQNVGKLGSFECGTDDGKVVVSVGSGLSGDQRVEYWGEDMVGEIITILFNGIEDPDENGERCLYLPIFVEVRPDRNDTDTLEKLEQAML